MLKVRKFNLVSPDYWTVKPDTHDETFVCNFCLQLLCVSYSTVQTMKLLYATSPYLLLFSAKIMNICIKPLSTWCLLRRTKLLSHCV